MATWRKIINAYDTTDATTTSARQVITPADDITLVSIRAEIAQYDNPTWTSVTMKLYAFDGTNVRGLIANSFTSYTKAECFTLANGFKSLPFNFANVQLKAGTAYAVVVNFVGYSTSGDAYVGWTIDWPDTIYRSGFTPTLENGAIAPAKLEVIGDKL